jgi:hypothetical protein
VSTTTVASEAIVTSENFRAISLALPRLRMPGSASERFNGVIGRVPRAYQAHYRQRFRKARAALRKALVEADRFDAADGELADQHYECKMARLRVRWLSSKLDEIVNNAEYTAAVGAPIFAPRRLVARGRRLVDHDSSSPALLAILTTGRAPRLATNSRHTGSRRVGSGSRAGPDDDGDGDPDPPGVALRRPGGNTAEIPLLIGGRR